MNRHLFKFACSAVAALLVASSSAVYALPTSAIVNVGRSGTASQSSTGFGGAASRAIDGGLGLSYGVDKTTTHTNNQAGASWTVDLPGDTRLQSVEVFSRGDCCNPLRLANFDVDVLNNNAVVGTQTFAGSVPINNSEAFNFSGLIGDAVRVQLNGSNFLSLREVVVLGEVEVQNGSNLAGQFGTATQSSTRNGGGGNAAQFAIDGNTNGSFGGGSVTHTNAEAGAFLEVDLNSTFHIDNIQLFNRTDCCQGRLSNFDIDILDEDRNVVSTISNPGGPGSGFHAVDPGTQGRFVRVQLNGTEVLSLAEIEVNGGVLQNLARNPLASVSQSTTRAAGGAAERAIDGITSGVFGNNSVTHTLNGGSDPQPTFDLDLGLKAVIDELVIFNRTDCCSERLSGAEVSILGESGNVKFSQILGATNGQFEIRLDIDDVTGQFVRIQLQDGSVPLSIAELQVFGVQAVPEPTTAMLLGLAGMGLVARRRRKMA